MAIGTVEAASSRARADISVSTRHRLASSFCQSAGMPESAKVWSRLSGVLRDANEAIDLLLN